jgi:GrpB-like predicted nucleotidyltransferase (UPF0157 family)
MDEIDIVPADPAWPALFAAEAARLWAVLSPPMILDIQHFGSTAVPGLAAKPIIDMLLATPDLAAARTAFPPILQDHGYTFWVDNPQTDRMLFIKGLPPSAPRRTHHLHVAEWGGALWSQLAFRDHLRNHPQDAAAYAALKHELAIRHRGDREAYTAAKSAFIRKMTVQGCG